MKIAEQQSRSAGFFQYNRLDNNPKDVVVLPQLIDPTRLGDWKSLLLTEEHGPQSHVALYNHILKTYPKDDTEGYAELEDWYISLKNAGYHENFPGNYLVKIPVDHPAWKIPEELGFEKFTASFTVLRATHMTPIHLDHSFEVVYDENDSHCGWQKKLRFGLNKDYMNRKILIALEDALPGQTFHFGSQTWQNWKAGDGAILKHGMPHWAFNFSSVDRTLLQMSGVVSKEWCEKYDC